MSASAIQTTIFSRGATYKICWSTEATQQVLGLYEKSHRLGEEKPITYSVIISQIRLSKDDSVPIITEFGEASMGLFLIKHHGVAYEVVVNYYSATANGGSNVCEISAVLVNIE